ncbi:competence-specific regulator [Kaistia algarum]|uniref:TfoX/Sxy family protein n=1 Tax=Kaistia algarum TaxID=2083279 RepID=UPI000CE76EA1|nr:TfoX/Sxy family protein [Kaistia algarum]MCX5515148.1 TfoX/Sxy family protein [Kaistia algarum]PPE79870.1 competence-specific regulator [Kaistia algarum]
MDTPISSMRGIGPRTATWLKDVGVETEDDLRRMGAIAAYRRLKHSGPKRVSLNALWGLHAALEGIPWTAVDRETKQRLLATLAAGG